MFTQDLSPGRKPSKIMDEKVFYLYNILDTKPIEKLESPSIIITDEENEPNQIQN